MTNRTTDRQATFRITPHFKFAVYWVSGFILLFVTLDLVVTLSISDPTADQQKLASHFADAWKAGTGAWFGLFGGRAIDGR
jgi:hypothetical protein